MKRSVNDNETLSKVRKRARLNVVHEIATKFISGEKDIFNKSSMIYPWLSCHMVNGCVRRLKEKSKPCDALVVRNEETRLAVTNLETSLVPYTIFFACVSFICLVTVVAIYYCST